MHVNEKEILKAISEKKIFIGLHMLCRFLNNRGYIRYGCNAKYKYPYKPKNKINPCKSICKNNAYYPSKVRYWIMKLFKENKIYTQLLLYLDSKNPNSKITPSKYDLFRIITINKDYFDFFFHKYIKT
ncbi:hypothetical protein ES702_02961 [subsurface metagenome]